MDLKEIIGYAELLKQVDKAPNEIKRLIWVSLESARKQSKKKKGSSNRKKKKVVRSFYVKMDKIEKLLKESGAKTVKEIATELDDTPSNVYYALKQLVKSSPHTKKTGDKPAQYYYDK